MHLNPYGADPVCLAADLVNDWPPTAAELAETCADAGVVIETPVTAQDHAAVASYLTRWEAVVDAADPHERASTLNVLLADHATHPRLTDHDGHWHLHYRPDVVTFAAMMTTMFSVGTALHLTSRGMDRLARCAAADCSRVFADTSRGGRQKYCSPRCNNRAAVRRHRSRPTACAAPIPTH